MSSSALSVLFQHAILTSQVNRPESVLKSEFSSSYSPFNLPSTFDDNPVSGSESRTTCLDTSPYSPAPPVHLEHAWTEKIMKAEDKGEQI